VFDSRINVIAVDTENGDNGEMGHVVKFSGDVMAIVPKFQREVSSCMFKIMDDQKDQDRKDQDRKVTICEEIELWMSRMAAIDSRGGAGTGGKEKEKRKGKNRREGKNRSSRKG
jgi:hypothetical protein